jgi:hypothetical protein
MVYLRPKIQICGIFLGPWNGKCWHILPPFGIFMTIWYSLWSFGTLFPFWYFWTRKNLATLVETGKERKR